jgi:hypothetical protein
VCVFRIHGDTSSYRHSKLDLVWRPGMCIRTGSIQPLQETSMCILVEDTIKVEFVGGKFEHACLLTPRFNDVF